MKITVFSYKKAQAFKKDYVRMNGAFLKFNKNSANHSTAQFDITSGEFDARGSRFQEGLTKWNATQAQSWAKFKADGEKLTAFDFDGNAKPLPKWIEVMV